jgi:uncharacterized protein YcbX
VPPPAAPNSIGTLAALWRYPVKSMQGEQVQTCDVDERGLAGDRSYGVIDVETGKVASAKRPRRWAALLGFRATFTSPPAAGEQAPPVRITFPDASQRTSEDPDLDDRLSDALGRRVHLASTAPASRVLEETWLDEKGPSLYGAVVGEEDEHRVIDVPAGLQAPAGTFFDFAAIHLLATSTLHALEEAHPEGRIDIRRFRPNLVVDLGGEAFVENGWVGRAIRVGGSLRLNGLMATMRCVMTTLPQPGLPRDPEVLRATGRNRVAVPSLGTYPCAGLYAPVLQGGRAQVGDPVAVD